MFSHKGTIMDLLEELLGLRGKNRGRRRDDGIVDNISDTVRGITKWIIGCGCLLVAGFIALIVLMLAGVIDAGEEFVVILIIIGAIIAAIASIVRNSIADRYSG
jgi:hypothetical protein